MAKLPEKRRVPRRKSPAQRLVQLLLTEASQDGSCRHGLEPRLLLGRLKLITYSYLLFSPTEEVKKEAAQHEREPFLAATDSAFESSEPEKIPKIKKTPKKRVVRDEATSLRRSARISSKTNK